MVKHDEKSDSITVLSEEEKRIKDDQKIDELVKSIIGNEEEARRLNNAMNDLRRKIGLLPLESPDYKPQSLLEYVIYNMRWNQKTFTECSILQLHEYEMALCAHISFCKGRENRWMSAYKIEKQSFDRAVSQASRYCSGKTMTERNAEAIMRNETLQKRQRTLEIYKLYADQCENISETFIQMDNSLKKLIDTRKLDYEYSKKGV